MIEKIEAVAHKGVFKQIGARSISGINVPFAEAIAQIKSNVLSHETDTLRHFKKEGKITEAKLLKQSLPAVTFAATYKRNRISGNEDSYNELCVIDIDDLSPEDHEQYKKSLYNDNLVFAVWTSPSGNGIKGLILLDFGTTPPPIDKVAMFHRVAFRSIQSYLKDRYQIELDGSGKDVTRLCFLSCDPEIHIKSEFDRFPIKNELLKSEEGVITESRRFLAVKTQVSISPPPKNWMNPANRNKAIDRLKMQSIIKYLRKRHLSITFQYDQWYHTAFGIANTFTFDLGYKYFSEISKIDTTKYDDQICRRMLEYAYSHSKGQIALGTIIYYAQNLGYE